ncbi:conserved hypothetical protein [Ricinus communis]|uniref:Peptidase C1A papain C-terminal domain-containing protein n=1 Tax=Ricinus communis TaxID=3988 RepID=B9TIJ9_RICCO|nr:conserved hypothetical protein [Ricinus communis]
MRQCWPCSIMGRSSQTCSLILSFVNLAPGAVYRLEDADNSVLHSICVVGYDQQAQYWIVMNSYGAGWGDGGFGHIAFGSGGLLSKRAGWQVELASHQ